MATVYRKSPKGQHEIETRANRLGPRLRTALILVDGRRNDRELQALVQSEPEATLLALLEGGYIELVSIQVPAEEPSSPRRNETVPASAPAPAPAPAPVPAAAPGNAGLAERRRLAVRHLTDQLGPIAETLALRIEKARHWDDLRPLLEQGQRLLQSTRGASAAAGFGERFIATPPG